MALTLWLVKDTTLAQEEDQEEDQDTTLAQYEDQDTTLAQQEDQDITLVMGW